MSSSELRRRRSRAPNIASRCNDEILRYVSAADQHCAAIVGARVPNRAANPDYRDAGFPADHLDARQGTSDLPDTKVSPRIEIRD